MIMIIIIFSFICYFISVNKYSLFFVLYMMMREDFLDVLIILWYLWFKVYILVFVKKWLKWLNIIKMRFYY